MCNDSENVDQKTYLGTYINEGCKKKCDFRNLFLWKVIYNFPRWDTIDGMHSIHILNTTLSSKSISLKLTLKCFCDVSCVMHPLGQNDRYL